MDIAININRGWQVVDTMSILKSKSLFSCNHNLTWVSMILLF